MSTKSEVLTRFRLSSEQIRWLQTLMRPLIDDMIRFDRSISWLASSSYIQGLQHGSEIVRQGKELR